MDVKGSENIVFFLVRQTIVLLFVIEVELTISGALLSERDQLRA